LARGVSLGPSLLAKIVTHASKRGDEGRRRLRKDPQQTEQTAK